MRVAVTVTRCYNCPLPIHYVTTLERCCYVVGVDDLVICLVAVIDWMVGRL